MDADNSFYVKFIATYAPTFFGYIISVLAMVAHAQLTRKTTLKTETQTGFFQFSGAYWYSKAWGKLFTIYTNYSSDISA
jgi:hypothetical protein